MECGRCGMRSPEGMRFCGGCGAPIEETTAPEAPTRAPTELAERRHMTVMFCDLVGSTPLAERVDAEDLRDVLADFQGVCVEAVETFDGHISKYMGDGVLAYFGYPHAHEDDPRRAVHAGLALIERLRALNERLAKTHDLELHVRVGVHTGLVVAGEMGAGQTREEFAIVGETPNIAARLEAAAGPDTVAISDVTMRLVDGYFTIEPKGALPLKGVSRPIQVFEVGRATDVVDRLEVAARGPLTPLIGRRAEIDRLLTEWESVAAGQGSVVHITGEAGIGKSRVARALGRELAGGLRATFSWQCSPYHQTSALHPVIRFIESWLGLTDIEAADQVRRVEAAVERAGLDTGETLGNLTDLLGIDAGIRSNLSPLDARAARMLILESLLVTDSSNHPLLLVVEDLHWADPTTLELLGRLVDRIPALPVMAVFTSRPDFSPPWSGRSLEMALGPLSDDEVSRMIGAATPQLPVSADLATRVAEAADGIPLFVEEMVRMLSSEADRADPAAQLAEPAVPATLRGLLTARLDRLEKSRDVAQVAAVLGRDLPEYLLAALVPHDPPALAAALEELVAADVLRQISDGPRRYEFTHALLQDAAYATLLRRRRREVHTAAADVMTSRFPTLAESEPEVIARHYTLAGRHDRAAQYWRAAGLRALAAAAFVEAVDHFTHGLEAVEEWESSEAQDVERIDLLTFLAAARQAGHGYADPEVGDIYNEAAALCEARGDDDRLIFVLRGLWLFHLLRADYTTAAELGERMLALGEARDDCDILVEGHTYLGMCASFRAELETARSHLETAIDLYTPSDRPEQIYATLGESVVMAHAYLAPVLWLQGQVAESELRSDQSLALAEGLSSPMTRAQAWGMRALFHVSRKELEPVQAWTEKVMAFCEERHIPYWQQLSSALHGWFVGRTGDIDAGLREVRQSVDAYLAAGSRLGLPSLMIMLADLHRVAGDVDAGLDAIRRGEQHIGATGERDGLIGLLRSKGELLLTQDPPDLAGAEDAFVLSAETARAQGARLNELRATAKLLKFRRRHGIPETMTARFAELCRWFPESCDLPDLREARALLEQLASEPDLDVASG